MYTVGMNSTSAEYLTETRQMELIDPRMGEQVNDPLLVRRLIGKAVQFSASEALL